MEKFLQNSVVSLLKSHSSYLPRHIALIMDGNRRFAQKLGIKNIEGHQQGFSALESLLEICLELRINVVTVYAFSIENFKRPAEEVAGLMQLFKDKLFELSRESELVKKYDVRIRVIGNLSLLPHDVLVAAEEAMALTCSNESAVLNICCPYTSRYEIEEALYSYTNELFTEDDPRVSVEGFERHLMTGMDPHLDILVRTSGETRLSDFMLWQATERCQIHFVRKLWPEFTFWDLLPIILSHMLYRLKSGGCDAS